MSTLVITVNGPFAYVNNYPQRGFMTLMAPMCAQHVAGIASIEADNQYVFKDKVNCRNHPAKLGNCEAHLYELKLNSGNVTCMKQCGNFLPCPTPENGFEPKEWRFWLKLPKPNIIVAVNPIDAVIITPGVQFTAQPPYAVGVRLIYTDWDFAPIPLLYRDQPAPGPNGPVIFALCDYGDDHAYLDIEYSSPLRDDPDHEDAVDCFENLMSTLGLPWSIFLPAKGGNLALLSSKLNDCTAPIGLIGG
jgi:hypothetical protein